MKRLLSSTALLSARLSATIRRGNTKSVLGVAATAVVGGVLVYATAPAMVSSDGGVAVNGVISDASSDAMPAAAPFVTANAGIAESAPSDPDVIVEPAGDTMRSGEAVPTGEAVPAGAAMVEQAAVAEPLAAADPIAGDPVSADPVATSAVDDGRRTIEMDMGAEGFSRQSIEVYAGETVRFVLRNTTSTTHEFTIGTPEMQSFRRRFMARAVTSETQDISAERDTLENWNSIVVLPGEVRELSWTFDETKRYEFGCNLLGRYEAGMKGQFIPVSVADASEADASKVANASDETPAAQVAAASEVASTPEAASGSEVAVAPEVAPEPETAASSQITVAGSAPSQAPESTASLPDASAQQGRAPVRLPPTLSPAEFAALVNSSPEASAPEASEPEASAPEDIARQTADVAPESATEGDKSEPAVDPLNTASTAQFDTPSAPISQEASTQEAPETSVLEAAQEELAGLPLPLDEPAQQREVPQVQPQDAQGEKEAAPQDVADLETPREEAAPQDLTALEAAPLEPAQLAIAPNETFQAEPELQQETPAQTAAKELAVLETLPLDPLQPETTSAEQPRENPAPDGSPQRIAALASIPKPSMPKPMSRESGLRAEGRTAATGTRRNFAVLSIRDHIRVGRMREQALMSRTLALQTLPSGQLSVPVKRQPQAPVMNFRSEVYSEVNVSDNDDYTGRRRRVIAPAEALRELSDKTIRRLDDAGGAILRTAGDLVKRFSDNDLPGGDGYEGEID